MQISKRGCRNVFFFKLAIWSNIREVGNAKNFSVAPHIGNSTGYCQRVTRQSVVARTSWLQEKFICLVSVLNSKIQFTISAQTDYNNQILSLKKCYYYNT